MDTIIIELSCLFTFAALGIKPKASHMLGKGSTTELHPHLNRTTFKIEKEQGASGSHL
jgi:hypothetical protein